MTLSPRIGDIYLMLFKGDHHEQSGVRPGVVFQNNTGNKYSPNLIAIPLTTAIKKMNMPTHVFLPKLHSGLQRDTVALCESLQIISKIKVYKYITSLSDKYMCEIAKASLLATGGIAFIKPCDLMSLWSAASKLNGE